jgi:hypothetical protein
MSELGDWPWPPNSPDPGYMRLSLGLRYLKQQVWNVPYDRRIGRLEELRNAIVTAFRNLEQPCNDPTFF